MRVFPSHMFYEDVMRTTSHPTIDKRFFSISADFRAYEQVITML
jgi:hypothetical protein